MVDPPLPHHLLPDRGLLCTCRPKLSAAKAGGLLALLVPLCVVVNRLVYSVHGVSLEGVSYDHAEVYRYLAELLESKING